LRILLATPKRHTADAAWGCIFILPQLLCLVLFSLIPLVSAAGLSFMEWDGFGTPKFIGFVNYIDEFRSDDFWIAIRNTAFYTLLTVPGIVVTALLVAMGVNKVNGKTFYRLFYFMPVVTSSVAVAVIWLTLLNGEFGLINAFLKQWFGIQGPNWLVDTRTVIPAIAMIGIWWGLGFYMVLFLAGLQSIPASYVEAAMIDGANRFQIFRHVTLPLLTPTLLFIIVIAMIGSFQVFDQAYVLTRGGPGKASYTLVYHLYQLGFIDFTFGRSSASAMILFAILLSLTMLQLRAQRHWVHYTD